MTALNCLSTCILGYLGYGDNAPDAEKAPEGVQSAIEHCFHFTEEEERTLRFNQLYREELDNLQRIWTADYAACVSDYRADQTHHYEKVELLFRRCIAGLQNRKRALLIAAGPSEPYRLMAENFEEIVCLNIDHTHAKHEVQKLPIEQQRKFTFIAFDLGHGLFARFAHQFAELRMIREAALSDISIKLFQICDFQPQPRSQLKFEADFTSSCCVLSQLVCTPIACAEIRLNELFPGPDKLKLDILQEFAPSLHNRLAKRHFEDLYGWTNKSGLACLVDTSDLIKLQNASDRVSSTEDDLRGLRTLLENRTKFFDDVRANQQDPARQPWYWMVDPKEGFYVENWVMKPKRKPHSPGPFSDF